MGKEKELIIERVYADRTDPEAIRKAWVIINRGIAQMKAKQMAALIGEKAS